MNYSVNQVRQLYVAKALKTPHVLASDAAGSIAVKNDTAKNHLYFEYKGADNLMRSDLIDTKNILYAKATDADDMAHELKAVTVTLDSDVNAGAPVAGQDYILRIAFRQFAGMSDEDVYIKYGLVHGVKKMTAANFYTKMKESLEKNFSRELTKLLEFTASESGLVITEVEQDWTLGVKSQVPVYFEVIPTTITYDGDEVVWGITAEGNSNTTIPNSKQLADLEYFCMGERGDQYRNVGWPNVIPTKYILNGEDPDGYDVLDIHYYYEGAGENPQKSEKDITIVAKATVIGSTSSGLIQALKDKGINVTKVQ